MRKVEKNHGQKLENLTTSHIEKKVGLIRDKVMEETIDLITEKTHEEKKLLKENPYLALITSARLRASVTKKSSLTIVEALQAA